MHINKTGHAHSCSSGRPEVPCGGGYIYATGSEFKVRRGKPDIIMELQWYGGPIARGRGTAAGTAKTPLETVA